MGSAVGAMEWVDVNWRPSLWGTTGTRSLLTGRRIGHGSGTGKK